VNLQDDGNDQLAKFLIQNKLVAEEVVTSSMERLRKKNAERQKGTMPLSLVDEICRRGAIESETLLSGILERSKFAYIPLEYYDIDRAIVKMLPEELTVGRLIVPFDVMSRTLMIAMANPFDVSAKENVQQLLDYNIQWHLASPAAVTKALAETYKIGSAPDSLSFRFNP
jgi:type IV pilus assembly protein PilB